MSGNFSYNQDLMRGKLSALGLDAKISFCQKCARRYLLNISNVTEEVERFAAELQILIERLSKHIPESADVARSILEEANRIRDHIDATEGESFDLEEVCTIVHYAALTLSSNDANWAMWAGYTSYDIAFQKAQAATGEGFLSAPLEVIEAHPLAQDELLSQLQDIRQLAGH